MQVCQNFDFFEIFFEILNQKIARIPNIFSDFVSDQKCGFSTGSDFYFNERQNLVTSRARISAAHNTSHVFVLPGYAVSLANRIISM